MTVTQRGDTLPPRAVWMAALGLIALLVVGNPTLVAWWMLSGAAQVVEDRPATVSGVVESVPLSPQRAVVATIDNEVVLVDDGDVRTRVEVDGAIGALAAESDGSAYYVGTSLGSLYVLAPDLDERAVWEVDQRIVGLSVTENGDLFVAQGTGAYSTNYVVERYSPADRETAFGGAALEPSGRAQAAFTVSAFDAADGRAVYGTVNARVGLVDLTGDGEAVWESVVRHEVTALAVVEERGWTLVGDQDGNVLLLDADGVSQGRVDVSEHPITAISFHAESETILAADRDGELIALDENGEVRLERDITGAPIHAIHDAGGARVVVPQTGEWARIDVGAVRAAGAADQLRAGWISGNILAGAGLLLALAVWSPQRRTRWARLAARVWSGRIGYLLVLPALLLTVVFSFYPSVSAFYYSFTDFSLRSVPEWVGLDNYERLLTDDVYFRAGIVNMAIIVVASFIKTVTVPLLAAELVYWLKNHFHQYIFRTVFVLSSVVPALVLTLLWRQVYDPHAGLLNELLSAVGLDSWRHAWLGEESTALAAVIGVGFPYLQTFAFLIFLGGLLTINRELYDSAAIDGAGLWQRFRYVDLAHLRPQFRIMTFFALVGAIEGFASIFILTQGGPGYATYVPALQMYDRIGTGDLGYASAIGVVLFVLIIAATIFILRFRRSSTEQDT